MKKFLIGILAIIGGLIVGSAINMGIIMIGPSVFPLPEGVDPTDMENLAENMHLFKPVNFIMPFFAHAFGTLTGAAFAAFIVSSAKLKFAMAISVLFLIGGIMNVYMLPSPMWFNIVDLVFAYLPMGWMGWNLTASSGINS
ncbi:MAG: hypothetical protein JXQ96_11105 [Cyclobacteriaceae bacterium]